MATGLEMLVSSIFKAAGVDAEKAKEDIANYGRQLGEKIAALDASLMALRVDQNRVFEALMALSEQIREAQTCYARPGAGTPETQENGVKRSTNEVNGEQQHA